MKDIRVINKRVFAVGELRKIAVDHSKALENRFIKLFFEKIQSNRLSALERSNSKSSDEQSRDYWAGYAQALSGIKSEYDRLAEEVDETLKAG